MSSSSLTPETPALFAPHQVYSAEPFSLPVAAGGFLDITPGNYVPYRVSVGVHRGAEIDGLAVTTELVDAEGRVYHGRSHVSLEAVMAQIGSLTAFEPVMPLTREERERKLVESRTFFRDAKSLHDDGFSHVVAVMDEVWVIPFHYQAPRLALYYSGDEQASTLWMHGVVSNFEGIRASNLPKDGEEPSAKETKEMPEEWDDTEDFGAHADDDYDDETGMEWMPDLHFPVDLKPYFFTNHYADPCGAEPLLVPRPVVYERLEGATREPNPLIVFRAPMAGS